MNRKFLLAVLFATFSGGLFAAAGISDTVIRQRWPWNRLIDVTYALTGVPEGEFRDVKVTFTLDGEQIDVPPAALSGERFRLVDGYHTLSLDPERVPSLAGKTVKEGLRVSLTPLKSALYVLVDLAKSAGEDGQIEYVYEEDLHAGLYGSVETNLFGLTGLAWTAVTNNADYKTTKIVFRRIEKGSVLDVSGKSITVDEDFFMAVFETTFAQVWNAGYTSFKPGWHQDMVPAVNGYDLAHLIGADEDYPSDCCIAAFRVRTGLDIDLPTCLQWEYACRAGSTTLYNDNGTKTQDVPACVKLALCQSSVPTPTAPQEVGLLQCNAWGLYDTLGNACEWCVDRDGATRYRPGGSWRLAVGDATCSNRKTGTVSDNDPNKMNGFRLMIRQ